MFVRSAYDVQKVYDSVGTIKRLSDRIIGIGPINLIGLDGILAWVPGVGTVYSIGASLFIMANGIRVRMSPVTFVQTSIILLIDSGVSGLESFIPFLPAITDTLFQGHLYAAHIVQKEIEKTLYLEESAREAHASGRHRDNLATMKATKGKKRLVYLLP
ncbi:DUF4112 domain-containing protein [Asticcacaulis sp. AND118]|uniref:DUF4112 domain-containing protein n=1 Tax=Asticcacaulis sp. AND118 TaxID=2840468 RepID=UPI001CFFCBAC|nr:DUF4112 domain-containing protein [Asticcacaulis sp. AND118]UDF02608.1 DUF4112 domain-containing protein [Asticcacaulis sp. AND118]